MTHARATLPGPFEADRAGRLARSRPRHFPSRTGPSWRGAAAAALAALAVLPLGLADGGYFGRSFTTLTVVFGPNLDAPFTPCPTCIASAAGQRSEPCGCDGAPWIVCPVCGHRCDVDLPTR